MTENPTIKVLERLTRMAKMQGTCYCRITWDPDKEMYNFTPLLKEHIIEKYDD